VDCQRAREQFLRPHQVAASASRIPQRAQGRTDTPHEVGGLEHCQSLELQCICALAVKLGQLRQPVQG